MAITGFGGWHFLAAAQPWRRRRKINSTRIEMKKFSAIRVVDVNVKCGLKLSGALIGRIDAIWSTFCHRKEKTTRDTRISGRIYYRNHFFFRLSFTYFASMMTVFIGAIHWWILCLSGEHRITIKNDFWHLQTIDLRVPFTFYDWIHLGGHFRCRRRRRRSASFLNNGIWYSIQHRDHQWWTKVFYDYLFFLRRATYSIGLRLLFDEMYWIWKMPNRRNGAVCYAGAVRRYRPGPLFYAYESDVKIWMAKNGVIYPFRKEEVAEDIAKKHIWDVELAQGVFACAYHHAHILSFAPPPMPVYTGCEEDRPWVGTQTGSELPFSSLRK